MTLSPELLKTEIRCREVERRWKMNIFMSKSEASPQSVIQTACDTSHLFLATSEQQRNTCKSRFNGSRLPGSISSHGLWTFYLHEKQHQGSMTLFNALIRTHHITSRKKVAKLRQAAANHNVLALLRSGGAPGIMYVEGEERGVRAWVDSVHVCSFSGC